MSLQIYIASVLAMSDMQDTVTNGVGTFMNQLPALLPAASIEEAAELARSYALGRWPISEGWHSHQAAIVPITNEFHHLVESNRLGGIAASELEQELPGKTFELGPEGVSPTQ